MKSYKIANSIILALSTTLIVSSIHLVKKYNNINNKSTKELTINQKIQLINENMVINKLNNVNKMVVLSGDISIKATYSNKEITEDDINFKWVKDFIHNANSKDLYVLQSH